MSPTTDLREQASRISVLIAMINAGIPLAWSEFIIWEEYISLGFATVEEAEMHYFCTLSQVA